MPPHITRAAREATAAVTEAALRADADLAPVTRSQLRRCSEQSVLLKVNYQSASNQ